MNYIIDVLSDPAEVNLNSISNESLRDSSYRQNDTHAAIIDKCDNMASCNLFPQGQDKPSIEGARFDSPDRGICKSRLVVRYFPDKKTGFYLRPARYI